MITEDYISFEVAKLLKEKGFDEKCNSAWLYNPKKNNSEYFVEYLAKDTENNTELGHYNEPDTDWAYSAPTLQMTIKWLREIYEQHIVTQYGNHEEGYISVIYSNPKDINRLSIHKCVGKSYEEACEEAIKYCLTNLI